MVAKKPRQRSAKPTADGTEPAKVNHDPKRHWQKDDAGQWRIESIALATAKEKHVAAVAAKLLAKGTSLNVWSIKVRPAGGRPRPALYVRVYRDSGNGPEGFVSALIVRRSSLATLATSFDENFERGLAELAQGLLDQ